VNLVGKILTVLIFVMSLVFMSFAVAVYATHKNWMDVVTNPNNGLALQLKNGKSRNQELRDQKDALVREVTQEQKAAEQVRIKLQEQFNLKKQQLDEAKLKEARLVKDTGAAVAAMNAAQATLASLRGEVEKLRTEILREQGAKDASVKEVIQLTDQMHQLTNELKRLKQREISLAADLAKAELVLKLNDLDKDLPPFDKPPRVEGVVLAVPSRDLIQISIGADDGLQVGHTLEVFRSSGGVNRYVGRVQVVETHPDAAVCSVDQTFLKSPIQRGDRVASRIR